MSQESVHLHIFECTSLLSVWAGDVIPKGQKIDA